MIRSENRTLITNRHIVPRGGTGEDRPIEREIEMGFEGWKKKDVWTQDGEKYRVEISRHEAYGDDDEKNRWCVYAWIYRGHWLFDRFSPEQNTWDTPHIEGGHSYPSYFKSHRNNEGELLAYQKGWDYHHDGDYRFGGMRTKEDAWEVFSDANVIFKYLAVRETEGEA